MAVTVDNSDPPSLRNTPTPHLAHRTTPVRKWKVSTLMLPFFFHRKNHGTRSYAPNRSTFQWSMLHWPWPLTTAPTTKETPFLNAAPPLHRDLTALAAGTRAMKHSNYCNYDINKLYFKRKMTKMTMIMTLTTINDKDYFPPPSPWIHYQYKDCKHF